MFDVKVVSFIRSDLTLRGGSPTEQANGDCARRITEFWTDDGILIFEYDSYKKKAKVFRDDLL